ncbi:MAG: ATP-binding protein [Pseudomonadota bacterium]
MSIKASNFKCFGVIAQGFDEIKPINLVVGRNNSGKSSLLDLVYYSTKPKIEIPKNQWHGLEASKVIFTSELTDGDIISTFPSNTSGGGIPGQNHFEFGKPLIGTKISWSIDAYNSRRFLSFDENAENHFKRMNREVVGGYKERLAGLKQSPLVGFLPLRLHAERNILPEPENFEDLTINGDGRGCTNLIQTLINHVSHRSDLVEKILLNEINTVLNPDSVFTDIVCQKLTNGYWEIYLEEEHKGRIPLSESGSGLKTIILVLCFLHLIPVVTPQEGKYIFCFEELENNLHPAVIRRLLAYLRQACIENNHILFITTHSNVAIDVFGNDESAQIIHVTHNGKESLANKVITYIHSKNILDDLDVRASDLLQANGIIWVEGPSDRIYINKFVSLWSNDSLKEGMHYQCVFYGGRLLSHLSGETPDVDSLDDMLAILRVNKNSALLMDSDKRGRSSKLNETKVRIINELENSNCLCWVTRGKEIENYIPSTLVSNIVGTDVATNVGQYECFFDYLDSHTAGLGKKYSTKKTLLAEQLTQKMTKDNMQNTLDLSERVETLCSQIRKWNSIR